MPQKTLVTLQNPKTGYTYYTRRNRKGEKGDKKLTLKKFDPIARAYAEFQEQKKNPKAKKEVKAAAPKKKAPAKEKVAA